MGMDWVGLRKVLIRTAVEAEPKVASVEATTTEDITVGLLSPEERGPFVGRYFVQAIASLFRVEGMLWQVHHAMWPRVVPGA